jgi:hypothetical protein
MSDNVDADLLRRDWTGAAATATTLLRPAVRAT